MCDQRKGFGSFYSKMNGQDCSKTIASNGWGEDLGRFGIKYQIFGDSVHESVFCRKSIDPLLCRSIYLNSRSIDPLLTL